MATVRGFADLLAKRTHSRVLVPTHPGFGGTSRPAGLASTRDLAAAYLALLDELDLADVTVIGNSFGGWIAAEMALLGSARVSGYVLVDAVGIDVPGHPVADFFSLGPAELARRSYADPGRYGVDPAALPSEARAAMAGNRAALEVYAGHAMTDPTLAARLGGVAVPMLVVWGEADAIADADYGRAYAEAVPGAAFRLMRGTGHLPQVETPEELARIVWAFADRHATPATA